MERDKKCNQCNKDAKFVCGKCKRVLYCSQTCANVGWRSVHYKNCGSYMLIEGKRGRDQGNQPPEPLECVNEDDPITLESISDLEPENTFVLHVGDKKYCFQLDSLVQWVQHNPINPLTRAVLSAQQLADITEANGRLLEHNRILAVERYRRRQARLKQLYHQSVIERFGKDPYKLPNKEIIQLIIMSTGENMTITTVPEETLGMFFRYAIEYFAGFQENPFRVATITMGIHGRQRIISPGDYDMSTTLADLRPTDQGTVHIHWGGFPHTREPWTGPPSLLE